MIGTFISTLQEKTEKQVIIHFKDRETKGIAVLKAGHFSVQTSLKGPR